MAEDSMQSALGAGCKVAFPRLFDGTSNALIRIEDYSMSRKILPLITGGALLIGALAIQACSDTSPGYAYAPGGYAPRASYAPSYAPSYGYAPSYAPAYVEPAPAYAAPVYGAPVYAPRYAYAGQGDYDDSHVWHDYYW